MIKTKTLALLAAGVVASLLSCEKEDEPVDMEAPMVNLEFSKNPDKLHNEVILYSEATDNGSIEKVAFFLNEESLGEAREEPYELLWNTKDVEDGQYSLKAVAYDETGNKTEAIQNIRVKNTLLSVNVENGYNPDNQYIESDEWIFLSDEAGELIGQPQQLESGANLIWQRPSNFESDTIYLNRLVYSSLDLPAYDKPNTSVKVYTYPYFTIDELHFEAHKSIEKEEPLGKVDIKVKNDFDGTKSYKYETIRKGVASKHQTAENAISYTINLYAEKEKGFSTYEYAWKGEDMVEPEDDMNEREKYYRMDDLEVDNSYEFYTSDYTAMQEQIIKVPFEYGLLTIDSFGYLSNEDETFYHIDMLFLVSNRFSELKVFYADIFPVRYTYISGHSDKAHFSTTIKGKIPEVYNMPAFTASIARNDKNIIQVNTSGNYDVGSGFWRYDFENESEEGYVERILYFKGQSAGAYAMPDVPASLLELYPQLGGQLNYDAVSMYDNKNLSSYDDIMKQMFTDSFSGPDYREESSLKQFSTTEGGRLAADRQKAGLTEEKPGAERISEFK